MDLLLTTIVLITIVLIAIVLTILSILVLIAPPLKPLISDIIVATILLV